MKTNIGLSSQTRVQVAAILVDGGITDFLTGLLEAHEKTAWMSRATRAR